MSSWRDYGDAPAASNAAHAGGGWAGSPRRFIWSHHQRHPRLQTTSCIQSPKRSGWRICRLQRPPSRPPAVAPVERQATGVSKNLPTFRQSRANKVNDFEPHSRCTDNHLILAHDLHFLSGTGPGTAREAPSTAPAALVVRFVGLRRSGLKMLDHTTQHGGRILRPRRAVNVAPRPRRTAGTHTSGAGNQMRLKTTHFVHIRQRDEDRGRRQPEMRVHLIPICHNWPIANIEGFGVLVIGQLRLVGGRLHTTPSRHNW
jgi:hypothetical protein